MYVKKYPIAMLIVNNNSNDKTSVMNPLGTNINVYFNDP